MKPEQAKALREPFPPELPCREYSGAKDRRGYGRQSRDGRVGFAHRWAYQDVYGPIPEGLELDHLCMNPACIEPTHLEAVTHAENMRRAGRAGKLGTGQASKTHCPRNHAYDETNTYRWNGERMCKKCRREAVRRHKERVR